MFYLRCFQEIKSFLFSAIEIFKIHIILPHFLKICKRKDDSFLSIVFCNYYLFYETRFVTLLF